MSGHSHFATIKRQKEAKDAAKGKVFSKLGRAISIAVKTGGGGDPASNYKLRMAVDAARAANMPKDNIERAISRAQTEAANLEEVMYEGFAPGGVGVLVRVATDNRNRSAQEMKNIFERGGGSLAGPGSVSFNFEPKGLMIVKKSANPDDQMLELIDSGVEDIVDPEGNYFEAYVAPDKLSEVREVLVSKGFEIESSSLIQKPKNVLRVDDASTATKIMKLMETFDDHDDVQDVFANFDILESVLKELSS